MFIRGKSVDGNRGTVGGDLSCRVARGGQGYDEPGGQIFGVSWEPDRYIHYMRDGMATPERQARERITLDRDPRDRGFRHEMDPELRESSKQGVAKHLKATPQVTLLHCMQVMKKRKKSST